MTWKIATAAVVVLVSFSAFATTEHDSRRTTEQTFQSILRKQKFQAKVPLDPSEAFVRTIAVLDHFGVPEEPDTESTFDDLQNHISESELLSRVKWMDFHSLFKTFSQVDTNEIRIYQDRGAMKVLDYSVNLDRNADPNEHSGPDAPYRTHLLNALKNPPSRPLARLKIALDPGHMGGDYWDEQTGKFVRDSKGRKLSEGVLALQIALLLERDLTQLGAQVMLTRHSLSPVSQLNPENFDLREKALGTLSEERYSSWFEDLLEAGPAGSHLYSAFSESAAFKKLFSESERSEYFIEGYDLDARVTAIQAFDPDLTLIIHLDAGNVGPNDTGVNPKPHDFTKVYVPGAFFSDEIATREGRALFGRHLVDTSTWGDSLKLSRAVVNEIHNELKIPFDSATASNLIEVEPGVLARSLSVQRRLTTHPSTYVECLFYNDPNEFESLLAHDHIIEIDGQELAYSNRLLATEQALRTAIVSFAKNYR